MIVDAGVTQAWALLEWRSGNIERARELFQAAGENCAPHAPLWAAWAQLEACALSASFSLLVFYVSGLHTSVL